MAAALIGVSFGGEVASLKLGREGKKSVEGSLAMFCVCFLVAMVFFWDVQLSEYAAVVAAATATLTVTPEAGGRNDWPIRVRVPGRLEAGTGSVSLNGKALPGPLTPSSYVDVEPNVGGWKVTDKIYLTFPPPLRVEAINDHHPEYNATLAFLYGPLVLAAVHMPTDIWVPHGNKFRTDASSFITRNGTDDTLTFEATAANGSKLLMLPLRDVTDETYVVHFMTAGTRPTQPKFGYCPHSDLTLSLIHI